ncbi:MAG: hypothetical protein JNL49_15250 [Bacteroidia bacterium]|jgi:hypothetical protein|nr:hypothetical protein [Bacteroidia bacterium]
MAINKNHLFEELNGIKCAIVEAGTSMERVEFLKPLLEGNGYTVVIAESAPPKVAPPVVKEGEEPPPPPPPAPVKYTIGVTDVTFNPTNAIFGRLLRTRSGHVVTLAYWYQRDSQSKDEVPYFNQPR